MVDLVDDIARTTIMNSVEGEEMRTDTPAGVQMIMAKVGGHTTVGRDVDGDGVPDMKLRYEFDNSDTVVQFPLGFCPASAAKGFVHEILLDANGKKLPPEPCKGTWGFVIKEWETITAVSLRDNLRLCLLFNLVCSLSFY